MKRPLMWIWSGITPFTVGWQLIDRYGRHEAHEGARHVEYGWHSMVGFNLFYGLPALARLGAP